MWSWITFPLCAYLFLGVNAREILALWSSALGIQELLAVQHGTAGVETAWVGAVATGGEHWPENAGVHLLYQQGELLGRQSGGDNI